MVLYRYFFKSSTIFGMMIPNEKPFLKLKPPIRLLSCDCIGIYTGIFHGLSAYMTSLRPNPKDDD